MRSCVIRDENLSCSDCSLNSWHRILRLAWSIWAVTLSAIAFRPKNSHRINMCPAITSQQHMGLSDRINPIDIKPLARVFGPEASQNGNAKSVIHTRVFTDLRNPGVRWHICRIDPNPKSTVRGRTFPKKPNGDGFT